MNCIKSMFSFAVELVTQPQERKKNTLIDQSFMSENKGKIALGTAIFLGTYFGVPAINMQKKEQVAETGGIEQVIDNSADYQTVSWGNDAIAGEIDTKKAKKYNRIGIIKWRAKNYEDAEYFFNKAIAADPTLHSPYGMLSQCYLDQGKNIDEAIDLANKALSLSPKSQPVASAMEYGRMARGYAMKGDCATANEFIAQYDRITRDTGFVKSGEESPVVDNVKSYCSPSLALR